MSKYKLNDNINKVQFLKCIALMLILGMVVMSLPQLCSGQQAENPSFKYSKQANEKFDPSKLKPVVDHLHHDHPHEHDHDHGHEHGHLHGSHEDSVRRAHAKPPIDMSAVWLHSIGSTLLISLAPFVLLYIIPLDNSDTMKPRLKILLAFASGGLLGDAFLHLIPHAAHPHSHGEHAHDDHHNHGSEHSHRHDMIIGLWVLGGIIAFLSVEKLVRLLKGGHAHVHGHQTGSDKAKGDKINDKKSEKSTNQHKSMKKKSNTSDGDGEVEITGYLNLAADFAHNFTDGLAIGASYLAGNGIGVLTTITILLHEVPHEIGDFAILIKSGCSRRKAIMLQLVTAMGAIAGTALALLGASGEDIATSWVLPFTAGGFIYIATVSVLPELLEESTKLGQSIKEIMAMLTGVALMVLIASYE